MIFYFIHDTTSISIFNDENSNNTTKYTNKLGKVIVGLDPLHQGREKNLVRRILKRLALRDKSKQDYIIEEVIRGLRTKESIDIEIYRTV